MEETLSLSPPQFNDTKKYTQIISSLPTANGWFPNMYQYQGFWFTSTFLDGVLPAQHHFNPHPNDIFLCSVPKSGTTWLKSLAAAIVMRQRVPLEDYSTHHPLLTKLSHEIVPILENDLYPTHSSRFKRDPQIPLVSSHLPYTCLPRSILDSDSKIIYVCRDPKDTFVSLWHFNPKWRKISVEDFPLEESYELFCKGLSLYGPIWEHILGYWKASLENPEKVLFLRYEDLKKDTGFHVKRMGEFMGLPFSLEEEKQGVVDEIVELCSFEKLSKSGVNTSEKSLPIRTGKIDNNLFFRKGETGDWRNYLTDEMATKLDQLIKEKFNGSGLTYWAV